MNKHIYITLTDYITEKVLVCPIIKISDEVITEVSAFDTAEDLLKSGGISIEALDRAAFGFTGEDIKTLLPSQLHIKWKEDLKNVKYEIEYLRKKSYSELSLPKVMKIWANKVDLSEPIDVSYEKDRFYIEDGHHRYYAANILNKPLNVSLEIKQNPIVKLAPTLSYDDFHRCIFKQIKGNTTLYENLNLKDDAEFKAKVIHFFKKYVEEFRGIKPIYTYKEIIDGVTFLIKKSKNYSADFYIGGSDNSALLDAFKYGEFWDIFDKDIYPDILETFTYETIQKNKKYKSIFDIEREVVDYLKGNAIEYKFTQANTGTKYFDTPKGKIRISDHTGAYRTYDNVLLYLFPQRYDNNEIEIKLDGIFK